MLNYHQIRIISSVEYSDANEDLNMYLSEGIKKTNKIEMQTNLLLNKQVKFDLNGHSANYQHQMLLPFFGLKKISLSSAAILKYS